MLIPLQRHINICITTENISAPSFWRSCFVLILEVEGWHVQWDVVFGVRGMQKCFLGRTGRFLAADKRGEHSIGGEGWRGRQLAPGIWSKTTCKSVEAGEQLQVSQEWYQQSGVSLPVATDHWSSLKRNGEGVRATLLTHVTLIAFPITRLMISVCDNLRKMLVVVNCLLVRKVGNRWPSVCLWGQGD